MGKPVIDTHRGDSVFRRDRAGKVLAYRGGAAGDAAGANSSNARTSGRGRDRHKSQRVWQMEKEIKPEQLVGTDTEPRQTGGGGDKTKKTTKSPFLVIFDFDWSLINENSDIWILRQLIPEQENDLRKIMKTVHFTDAMHEGMRRVHEAGISKERLIETLRKIPFFASMREAVFAMKEKGHRIYILSDANTEFIDAILSGYPGLKDCFVKVYSNIGHFDDNGRLHIKYYHQSSHGCSSPCPKNLCKGVVLDEILEKEGMRRRSGARREEKSYGGGGERRVVYIGDGGNDVCPAMRLDSIDYVFARSGFRLSKALTKSKPAAKVLMWSNGDEAKAHFDSVVLGAPDVHTSKPQLQQQQQGSRKEEQQRMSSECTRASSIVRTLQARVKDYSFLVCGIHPSLLKFIRGTLSSSSSSSSPSMQSTKGGEDGSGREG